MMKTTITYGIALLLSASLAFAADAPNATPDATLEHDIRIAGSQTEASRQATMVANLPLTDAQATAFWPVYREYRAEVGVQNGRFVQLVKKYSNDFDHMTASEAKSLTSTYLDIAQKKLDLKKNYAKKFEKVLPPVLVARAMQTEQKLDAMQEFTIARMIPLVPSTGG